MKTKFIKSTIALALASSIIVLAGCTGKTSSSVSVSSSSSTVTPVETQKKVTLTFGINFPTTEIGATSFKTIIANFQKENPNITIDGSSLPDYETTMKTKMAANDLPDLFMTHGWSTTRYAEYLTPLQDQPWVSKINPLIKPIVTNPKGQIFVLPMDIDVAGIVFNKDVLDAAKVDYKTILTWDDFSAACEKVKALGKTPIQLGGVKDDWTIANFFDWVNPSLLITDETKNFRTQLKDGSFDWQNYKPSYDLFMKFYKAGYFNKDAKEGTYAAVAEQLSKGNAAFALFGNSVAADASKLNPSANFGFMPLPAATSGDKPTVIAGEKAAVGIWKDTKFKAEALKFIDFLSKPESINLMASGNVNPTGLIGDGYKTNTGKMDSYFQNAQNFRPFGYFDREYLPSGMWDSMCKTGDGMIFGAMNFDQVKAKMKTDYDKLRAQ